MDSDAASVMSPMSPVGGSSVKGDSSKVMEVSIGNSEAALGHRKTVEDIVRAAWKARIDEKFSPGNIFKVTMIPRGQGFRVWMDHVRMEELTSKIMFFPEAFREGHWWKCHNEVDVCRRSCGIAATR